MIESIKLPNERRAGKSWVFRSVDTAHTQGRYKVAYIKVQKQYMCRTIWSLGRKIPTLMQEYSALERLRQLGVPVPEVLDFRAEGDCARLMVVGVEDALPIHQALELYQANAEEILFRCAGIIRGLHAQGWNHGALYPDHVLVGPAPDFTITLIDLEKADRGPWHRRDLDRLLRYLRFRSPELARWFAFCYETEVIEAGALSGFRTTRDSLRE